MFTADQRHQAKLPADRGSVQRPVAAEAPDPLLAAKLRPSWRTVDRNVERIALHLLTRAVGQQSSPVPLAPFQEEDPARASPDLGERAVGDRLAEDLVRLEVPLPIGHTFASELRPGRATGRIPTQQPGRRVLQRGRNGPGFPDPPRGETVMVMGLVSRRARHGPSPRAISLLSDDAFQQRDGTFGLHHGRPGMRRCCTSHQSFMRLQTRMTNSPAVPSAGDTAHAQDRTRVRSDVPCPCPVMPTGHRDIPAIPIDIPPPSRRVRSCSPAGDATGHRTPDGTAHPSLGPRSRSLSPKVPPRMSRVPSAVSHSRE